MKQTMKQKKILRNFVAKNAHKANKAVVFNDRTKYNRKEKHKNKPSW
jgi:hypothetical protein